MNPREKKLLIVIVLMAAAGLVAKWVYPSWIAPLLSYQEQISRLDRELEDKEVEIAKLDQARETYQEYVNWTGGTDEKKVGDQFQSTLNDMLGWCSLQDWQMTPKPSNVKKTGLVTLSYIVQGKGPLQNCMQFLKSFYELPYIARFRDLKLQPETSKRRGLRNDMVRLNGTIEVLVPPKFFGEMEPNQPPRRPKYRHKEDPEQYALIWEGNPFNRPVVQPKAVEPVKEPVVEQVVESQPPPPTPKGPVWLGDTQRALKVVRGCWAAAQFVQLVNTTNNQREYVPVGKKLDGGDLLMVHPFGALVRRPEGEGTREYVYPTGEMLSASIPLDEAAGPLLPLRAAAHHFLVEEKARAPAVPAEAPPEGTESPPGESPEPPGPLVVEAPDVTPETVPEDTEVERFARSLVAEIAGPPEYLAGEADLETPAPTPRAKAPAQRSVASPRGGEWEPSATPETALAGVPPSAASGVSLTGTLTRPPTEEVSLRPANASGVPPVIELAGPPESLAGPLMPEGTTPAPDVGPLGSHLGSAPRLPAVEIAGPPEELAGPLPGESSVPPRGGRAPR